METEVPGNNNCLTMTDSIVLSVFLNCFLGHTKLVSEVTNIIGHSLSFEKHSFDVAGAELAQNLGSVDGGGH